MSAEKNAIVMRSRSVGVTCSSPINRTTSIVGSMATMSSPWSSQKVSEQNSTAMTADGNQPAVVVRARRPVGAEDMGGWSGSRVGDRAYDRWIPADSVRALPGGVWVPGGLRRLQSGWDGRSPSGGFDSRPPPLGRFWASTEVHEVHPELGECPPTFIDVQGRFWSITLSVTLK